MKSKTESLKDQNKDDSELISMYQRTGDISFVAELVERYSSQILAFGLHNFRNKNDALDFAGEVFLKLCDKLKKEQINYFKSWLYTFMKNFFYDQKRREQLHLKYVNRLTINHQYEIEQKLFGSIDQQLLYQALEKLDEKERRCITYLYLEVKNYNEIMKETNWTFNQIRGTRERAIKKLKTILSKELGEFN